MTTQDLLRVLADRIQQLDQVNSFKLINEAREKAKVLDEYQVEYDRLLSTIIKYGMVCRTADMDITVTEGNYNTYHVRNGNGLVGPWMDELDSPNSWGDQKTIKVRRGSFKIVGDPLPSVLLDKKVYIVVGEESKDNRFVAIVTNYNIESKVFYFESTGAPIQEVTQESKWKPGREFI